MRLVLDTDVLVAAFRSSLGASRALLIAALEGRFTLLASTALWLEYEDVLTRPEQLAAARLSALAEVSEPVLIHYLWRPVLQDKADDHVLELAMNGRADMLVTFNQADFAEARKTFDIEIVTPSIALQELGEK